MARVILQSCFVCLLGAAPALAQQDGQPAPAAETQPKTGGALVDRVRSIGGKFEVVSENHLRWTDGVEQEWDAQTRFFADQVDWFLDTNRLAATGNVVFTTRTGHVAAESAEFDLDRNTAVFQVASGLMPLGTVGTIRQPGQDADVYFWGKTIEKVGDTEYRITGGGFTTCVQPTPRWEMATDDFVLKVDDYALARNTVFRVKGVPLLYLPIVYYPIKDDRATGFLLPTYSASRVQGNTISNAFFWAIDRSQDATFFYDWFSRSGYGLGTEYRYVAAPEASGNLRLQRLILNEVRLTDGGITTTLPASQSFVIRGSMNHAITPRVRARARFDYFSDIVSQQLYQQNFYQASQNSRYIEAGLTAAYGPVSSGVLYQRNELYTSPTDSYVYGSTPRVTTSVAPQRLFGSPVYASMNAEYAFLPDRTVADGVVTRDQSYGRVDVTPTVRVPLSRLTYLSVNTSASYHTTYYTRSVDSTGNSVEDPYHRRYMSVRSDIVGPVLTRIWDRPDSVFAERLKHVIEPAFSVDVTSQITDYTSTPVVGDVSDFVVGGSTRVTYGLTNRLFARGKPREQQARGQTREFLTVGLQQTFYSTPESARYDSAYQSTYGYGRPQDLSPVALTARVSPSAALDGNLRLEYDVAGLGLQTLSAGGGVNLRTASVNANYSHRRSLPLSAGSDYLSASTTSRWLDGRVTGTYSLSWDIEQAKVVSQTVAGSYVAQCCGLQLELQKFDYPDGFGYPSDVRFNVGFTLAGLGTFSNFFGALGGQP
jgi:hypothetical protein